MVFSKRDTQIVKGIAILMLLFYHLFYYEPMFIEYDVNFMPFTIREVMNVSKIGNICVSMFLFLSVYGMYKGFEALELQKNQMISYQGFFWLSVKRYASLMSGYLAVFISISICFFWELSFSDIYGVGFRAIYNFILDLAGLSAFYNTATLNSSWWYVELAIIVIFAMPLLYKLYQKIGAFLFPIVFLLPFVLDVNYMTEKYRIIILLALFCARNHFFSKMKEKVWFQSRAISEAVKGVLLLIGTGLTIYIRQYEGDLVYESIQFIAEGFLAFFFICFIYEFLNSIPFISTCLATLGKYSMSMYFSHLFFSYSFVKIRGYIFSVRYFFGIFVVLVLVVFLYSVILNLLEKVCRWDKLLHGIRQYCDKRVEDSFH